ncbi:MAG: HK97 family phage prohead protease [Negativicutes bacterium]|nr:HK97 family phage prohead protease [Negativicutes bacterium]
MPKSQRNQPPVAQRMVREATTINVEAINEDSRTVTLSFASEQPVGRWYGSEVLQIDAQSVNLSRFENGLGVLLFNHRRDAVLGKILRCWIDEQQRKGYAEVQFDDDEQAELIWQKVKSGTLRGVSVGYSVDSWEEVAGGKTSSSGRVVGPAYVALRWTPLEISIVSVPADDSVGVGRQIDENEEGEDGRMTIPNNQQQPEVRGNQPPAAASPSAVSVDLEAERQAERKRCAEITALCRDFNVDPGPFISDGRSLAEVQAEVLRQLKQINKPTETARASVGEEDAVKFSRAASDAILLRGGVRIEKPAEGATELRSMRLRDLMIECLERAGNTKARYLDDQALIREALTGAGAFAGILSNAANKSLSEGYAAAETTFEAWTGTGSNPDFKEATHYRLSEAGELQQMTTNGEFKHDEVKEESAKKSVLTFGRSWSLSRQAIINDDLSALTRLPARYAAAARRGINKLVYKKLATTSGIFTAPHGNLAGSGAAPSVETLGAGREAMRKQKNIRGEETLNIAPKFILIPAALETKTEQLLTSIADPAGNNANVRNPFVGRLVPVCDAELDQYSDKAWYLAAQAGLVDTIEVTYLNGQQSPVIESQVAFDVLGMKWRIYIDYGVTVLDYRGLYKNPGA